MNWLVITTKRKSSFYLYNGLRSKVLCADGFLLFHTPITSPHPTSLLPPLATMHDSAVRSASVGLIEISSSRLLQSVHVSPLQAYTRTSIWRRKFVMGSRKGSLEVSLREQPRPFPAKDAHHCTTERPLPSRKSDVGH